ncbi:MAG: hypothetical protein M3209_07170 [Acidobacteriota bacterium]|nr:hypothetical protein [Acidobacteriota bacterium]
MAQEEGNQELRVRPGSGASIGVDAGTDTEQTNREPSSGVSGQGSADSDKLPSASDRTGQGESGAERISKTSNAFVGEVGSGTGESTGATRDFVTANEETERKRNEGK